MSFATFRSACDGVRDAATTLTRTLPPRAPHPCPACGSLRATAVDLRAHLMMCSRFRESIAPFLHLNGRIHHGMKQAAAPAGGPEHPFYRKGR